MDTSNPSSPLLAQLVEHPVTPGAGSGDFTTASSRLNLTSVFDIVEQPKAEFIRQLAQYTDDDGAQAYENALSYATQLQWLHDQQSVNPRPSPSRSKRDLGSKAPSPLDEDWGNVCHPEAIAAIDSPVAYLRTLFLFATQLEKKGAATGKKKILLSQRRPDLGRLLIDHDTTFSQRPLLTLIDEMLHMQINLHHPDKDLHQQLRKARYPMALPYHHHHRQCQLALSGTRYSLGELNYRISKRLPFDDASSQRYATVIEPTPNTQRLLGELSPEQQKLLAQPLVPEDTLYEIYYGRPRQPPPQMAIPLENLDVFLKCTALNSLQLQALLAQNSFAPHASLSTRGQTLPTFGARYVNGTDEPPMTVEGISSSRQTAQLLNTSHDRFDRMQRMIRLQQWVNLPFAELDTLIVSAMECEGAANPNLRISHNTLRAQGVYRYLSRYYALKPLEFSAWLHRLPVQASANEQPLFDQVFNRTAVSSQPLPLDDQAFDSHTRQQLCAALALRDTPDSLQLLIEATPAPVARNLATYSAIYRQARIAQVFGLSVLHCKQLADLLGPSTWASLVTPTLRIKKAAPMDFLDVLMQMDWAVTWLKACGTSVTQLRQQLLLEPITDSPALQRGVDLLRQGPHPCIQQFLESPEPAVYSNELKLYYDQHFMPEPELAPAPAHLILLLPDITTLLSLPVNATSLRQLLLNPHWLDSEMKKGALVGLNLGTLYLLQRFRDCCDTYGLAQDSLLAFFQGANNNGPQNPNAQLSQWLGWDERELRVLTATLPSGMVRSMDQLDWIMRCRQACTLTRLSSQTLLDTSELDIQSDFSSWQSVGEAVVAAHQ